MQPLVALLSDFGSQDHYVGAMKGAVLAVCGDATVVDVVHELPAHDVEAAALALDSAYRAFPVGTVFLAVVDPGVGSGRRGLAAEAGGWRFVAPDNGLLSLVLNQHPEARIRALANQELFASPVSAVFHGRDIFGPVAGHLAAGLAFESVGPEVVDPVTIPWPRPEALAPDVWEARVLAVDRFGNLITNLVEADLERFMGGLRREAGDVLVIVEGVPVAIARTYSDVAEGEACALLGSSGRLEIAVNQGSAARALGAGKGTAIRIRPALSPTERMI